MVLRLKEMAREDGTMAVRDFGAELAEEFPGKVIPSKSTVQRILISSGFKVLALKKKTLIWPRKQ